MSARQFQSLLSLNETVKKCTLCPRLVAFRESVKKRAAFKEEVYWRKPVIGFGDSKAKLLILGLAPSAHGGNRTGRIFTGDESGRFLMNCLFEAGLANKPTSERINDGLLLKGCYITAIVKCVPPKNKPLLLECINCQPYWENELHLLPNIKAILALGQMSFHRFLLFAKEKHQNTQKIKFLHGNKYQFTNFYSLYASYHPSPQNTYTKKITQKMLVSLLKKIRSEVDF